jgi:hypothetical protein
MSNPENGFQIVDSRLQIRNHPDAGGAPQYERLLSRLHSGLLLFLSRFHTHLLPRRDVGIDENLKSQIFNLNRINHA